MLFLTRDQEIFKRVNCCHGNSSRSGDRLSHMYIEMGFIFSFTVLCVKTSENTLLPWIDPPKPQNKAYLTSAISS